MENNGDKAMDSPARKAGVKAWIEAMRLRTLPVSVAGVLAGGGCAAYYGSFRTLPFLICLLFAVMAQIVSNFANEYFDFKNGLDHKGREGFRRGVTEGDISPKAMRNATFGLLAVTCLIGCSLIIWGGWWLLAAGVAIAIFAIAYSAGPWPLSHHGLGDIAVVIFFGIVPVMLTAYVQTGSREMWPVALPISVALGLMIDNVLIVNNYRDADDDRAVGKRTTVVIFGRKAMGRVYFINGILAVVLIEVATIARVPLLWQAGALLYANLHYMLWVKLTHLKGAELNPVLGQTAMLVLGTSVWLLLLLCCN